MTIIDDPRTFAESAAAFSRSWFRTEMLEGGGYWGDRFALNLIEHFAALSSRPALPAGDEELIRAIGCIIAPGAFDPRMGSMSARAQKDGRAKAQQIIDLFASRPSSPAQPTAGAQEYGDYEYDGATRLGARPSSPQATDDGPTTASENPTDDEIYSVFHHWAASTESWRGGLRAVWHHGYPKRSQVADERGKLIVLRDFIHEVAPWAEYAYWGRYELLRTPDLVAALESDGQRQ